MSGVALGAEDGEEVFEGVAEPFGVVVGEFVNDFEEEAQGFGVAVWEVCVAEDVSEEGRDAGVFSHSGDGFGVEV